MPVLNLTSPFLRKTILIREVCSISDRLKNIKALFSWSWFDFFIKIQQSSDVKFTVWALDLKFQIRLEIFDLIFFLWLLISYQTSKLRPKINVWKKNQISDRKIKSCWNDLIWNLLLDLTWLIFAFFDVESFWCWFSCDRRKGPKSKVKHCNNILPQ